MVYEYIAIFYKEEVGYSVIFPDFNYMATQGESYDDAYEMAYDCLLGTLTLMEYDGETFPQATSIQDLDISPIVEDLGLEMDKIMIKTISVEFD